jgi:hypothetical protein
MPVRILETSIPSSNHAVSTSPTILVSPRQNPHYTDIHTMSLTRYLGL